MNDPYDILSTISTTLIQCDADGKVLHVCASCRDVTGLDSIERGEDPALLSIIDRQQAEIERLRAENNRRAATIRNYDDAINALPNGKERVAIANAIVAAHNGASRDEIRRMYKEE